LVQVVAAPVHLHRTEQPVAVQVLVVYRLELGQVLDIQEVQT
jgi:hypothetical protein